MKSSKVITLQQTDSLDFDFNTKKIKLNGSVIQMPYNGSNYDLSFEDYYCQLSIEDSSSGWKDLVISCNSSFPTSFNYELHTATSYGTATGQILLATSTMGTSYGNKISFRISIDDLRLVASHHEADQEFAMENDQGIFIKHSHNSDDLFHLWYGLS